MRRVLSFIVLFAAAVPTSGATSLDSLRQLMRNGQFVEAAGEAADLTLEYENRGEDDTSEFLELLRQRADALSRTGHANAPETAALVERMLVLAGNLRLEAGPASEVHRVASAVAWRSGDLPLARRHLDTALEIAESGLPADDPTTAQLRGNLSILLRRTGDLAAARESGEAAAAVCDADPFRECYTIHLALAQTYRAQGDLDAAAARYATALAEAARVLPAGHSHIPTVRHGLTLVETERGRYDVARDELERVTDELRVALGDGSTRLADALFSLGQTYRYLGNIDRALEIQDEVLSIRGRTLKPDAETIGYSHAERGRIFDLLDLPEDACIEHRAALAIFEAQFEPGSGELATISMAVAGCEAVEGNLDAARRRIESWTAGRGEGLTHGPKAAATVWSTAARLALADGRVDDAIAAYRNALAARADTLGERHPSLTGPLGGLARAYWRAGRPDDALAAARRAESLVQRFARGNLAGLTDGESRAFVATLARTDWVPLSGLVFGAGVRARFLESAWEWVLGRRGLIFDNEALRRRMVRGSGELAEAWQDVVDTRERLAAQWIASGEQPDPGRDDRNVIAAIAARERAEHRLASLSRPFRRRVEESRVELADVVAALPDRHALVEIVRAEVRKPGLDSTERVDLALILLPGGALRHAVLGPSADVDRSVAAWREALARSYRRAGDADVAGTGSSLRRLVWDPIAAAIGEVDTVLLVPEASLHEVPFAALPDADGRFLIESGPRIHVLGSARDVVRFGTATADDEAGSGMLVLADPDFGADAPGGGDPVRSACATTPRRALPASAIEARRIAELFAGRERVEVLRGASAGESALRRTAEGRRILHLATHGYFVPETCDTGSGAVTIPPLLRSGLVVARSDGDDGILTAEEITVLDLEGTELVVLSACDTGLGEIEVGEGVYGLRRAFELAGADTVVMSLWSVPDRQALRWMTAFYDGLLADGHAGNSARAASLTVLARLRRQGRDPHPWLWAGFVTAGNWR